MKTRYACLALLLAPALACAEPQSLEHARYTQLNLNHPAAVRPLRGEPTALVDRHGTALGVHPNETHPTWAPPVQTRDAPAPVAAPEISPAQGLLALTFFAFALAVARGRRRRFSSLGS